MEGGEREAPREAPGGGGEGDDELRAFMESDFYKSGAWKKEPPRDEEDEGEAPVPVPDVKAKPKPPARKRAAPRKKAPDPPSIDEVSDLSALYHIV